MLAKTREKRIRKMYMRFMVVSLRFVYITRRLLDRSLQNRLFKMKKRVDADVEIEWRDTEATRFQARVFKCLYYSYPHPIMRTVISLLSHHVEMITFV